MKKNACPFKVDNLVRLCEGVYLPGDELQIHSVKPSIDNNKQNAIVIMYSNAESNGYKNAICIAEPSKVKEFIQLLDEQIALQCGGPLSDPNVVMWMKK